MSTFGDRLKELRMQKKLGQKEIGALLGVSDSSIRKYESGDRTPTPEAIKKLANFFDVPTDYLLGNTRGTSWSTPKVSRDLAKFLNQTEIMFDGEMYKLNPESRQKLRNALEFAFYEAKKMNKRKKD